MKKIVENKKSHRSSKNLNFRKKVTNRSKGGGKATGRSEREGKRDSEPGQTTKKAALHSVRKRGSMEQKKQSGHFCGRSDKTLFSGK